MDADLLGAVLGRAAPALSPAVLKGYRRVFVAGRAYPMLLPQAGADVAGMLADGLTRSDARRLRAYESGYRERILRVRDSQLGVCAARVFLSGPDLKAGRAGWSLAQWRRKYKKAALRAAAQDSALRAAAQDSALRAAAQDRGPF